MTLHKRGIALTMALFLSVLVVVLAMSLLAWVQQDAQFARQNWLQNQAYFLAQSSLEYYKVANPSPGSDTFVLAPGSTANYMEIQVGEPTTIAGAPAIPDVMGLGHVSFGGTITSRALYVQNANFPYVQDVTAGGSGVSPTVSTTVTTTITPSASTTGSTGTASP